MSQTHSIATIKMLVSVCNSIDRCICLPHDNFSSTSPLGADTPCLRLSGLLAQTNIQHPSFLKLCPAARKVEDCTNSQIDRTTQIKLKRNQNANFLFHFWVIYVLFLALAHLYFVSTKQNNHLIFDNLFLWKTFIIQITNDNLQLTYFYHNYCYYKH